MRQHAQQELGQGSRLVVPPPVGQILTEDRPHVRSGNGRESVRGKGLIERTQSLQQTALLIPSEDARIAVGRDSLRIAFDKLSPSLGAMSSEPRRQAS